MVTAALVRRVRSFPCCSVIWTWISWVLDSRLIVEMLRNSIAQHIINFKVSAMVRMMILTKSIGYGKSSKASLHFSLLPTNCAMYVKLAANIMEINQEIPIITRRCFNVNGRVLCSVCLVALNRSTLITNRVIKDTECVICPRNVPTLQITRPNVSLVYTVKLLKDNQSTLSTD